MPEQFGDKSHDATPHRKQKAREEGQVAKSQDLSSAVLLIGSLLVLMYMGTSLIDFLGSVARAQFGGQAELIVDQSWAVGQWHSVVAGLTKTLLPMFGLFLILAVVVNVSQVGFLFLPNKLGMDLSRISPMKGMGRIFSLAGVVRLGLGIFKVLVVAVVAFWSLWSQRETILALGALDVGQIAGFIGSITLSTCLKIGAALFILAILDFAYQRWKHEQDLKMTSQEIREEMKNTQGDPQIAARRKAVQRQLVMNRLSGTVPKADVVVTNPTELAIAIQYDIETMPAPLVIAKGAGVVAQRIRRLALEHQIPILERKALAQVLYKQVELNHPIPTEQYAAVAEILRYVYELKGKSLPTLNPAA
jgi:flagellar biosynthetic protein FlhB